MVEINVTVADSTHVHGLVRRLRQLFDASAVSWEPARGHVRVRSEWESRTVIGVVGAVQSWVDEGGAPFASLAVGNRSYMLVGPSVVAPAIDTDPRVRALATVSAVVRSVHGADDSLTLLRRVCKSISENLGFERVGIVRDSTGGDMREAIAAYGWPRHELTECVASGELRTIMSEAKDTAALAFTHSATQTSGAGGLVVVPLITAGRCHAFLLADHGGTAFALEESERVLLSTLGTVISALLEKTIAHDSLLQASVLKTDYIALASHELRTPTAAVCGIAATLHMRGDVLVASQRRGLSQVLYEQGQRLHRLVDQLLDLSRLEAKSIRIVPAALAVRERTEEIVRGVAADRADEIEIQINPALLAHADPEAFDRIVSNLITNALRYGRGPIAVSASSHDRHFRLAVEDHGPGVPEELEPQLFDRFTRGHNAPKSGAGLGLSIARDYAHASGGELLYENATPHGARFELVVPIEPKARGANE